ncbi:MAG: hypothetical protein KC420_07255, partial [Myxococcales bacterium]|nr:hypothetical protein [Myxococcales bacterium]
LVLKDAPLRSIRGLGSLRGVDHLDLRGCRELVSLAGVEGLVEVRTIDLRGCTALSDLSALAALPELVAVLTNHEGPPGAFPPEVADRVTRTHLRGLVRRVHALGPATRSQT